MPPSPSSSPLPRADLSAEPLLEGMERNAAFAWMVRRRSWLRRVRKDFSKLPIVPVLVFGMLISGPAGRFGIAWHFLFAPFGAVAAAVVAARLHRRWTRGSPDALLLGRPLREWADLADTGYPAEDVARGIWGRKARDTGSFWEIVGVCGMALAFVAAALSHAGIWPPDRVAARVVEFLSVFVAGMAGFAGLHRRGNPWLALGVVADAIEAQAAGLPNYSPAALTGEERQAWLDILLRNSVLKLEGIGLVFGLALLLAASGSGGSAASESSELASWAWKLSAPLALLVGALFAVLFRRHSRAMRDDRYTRLVLAVRGAMNAARVAVHGPDAVVTGTAIFGDPKRR